MHDVPRFAVALLALFSVLGAGCRSLTRLDRPTLHFGGDYRTGEVRGHVQVPAGGNGGSTSHNRPKLEELGIGYVDLTQARAGLRWRSSEILLRSQHIEIEGSDRLETDLTTHGDVFPAGSLVTAEIGADWISIAYTHHFAVARDIDVAPLAGAAVLCFDYEMLGESSMTTQRSFNKTAPMVGLITEWRPGGGDFSMTLGLSATTPFDGGMPWIATQELLLKYRVGEAAGRSITASIGVATEQIQYDDSHKQVVPNEVDLSFGPLIVFGVELRF